ncbi:hypothetical protein, partial [Sphingomonas sp. 3-13AW]|uniref:hypothetical protein n=1 Tax=Sphingomonas sp. 3-13AW TaxID=3050450 RepID=UPI003BB7BDB9
MAIDARLRLRLRRNEPRTYLVRIIGLSAGALIAAAPRIQIRDSLDAPGTPNLELVVTSEDFRLGLMVSPLEPVGGAPACMLRIHFDRDTTINPGSFPYGALGETRVMAWGLQWGGITRLHGDLEVLGSAIDSNTAPVDRELAAGAQTRAGGLLDAGATVTIVDQEVIELVIDGAGELSDMLVTSTAAAERALDAATRTEAIASTGFRSVATYGAREAIPLDQRGAGMRVHVLEAERTFEWRSDLFAPGAWLGLRTEEELSRLDLMHGGLSQDKVYGLPGTLEALREADAAAVAVKILSPRAVALSSAANPRGYVEWATAGQPTSHVVSWGGRAITLDGQARRMDFPSYSLEQPFAIIGNSLSDPTDVTDRWPQVLAARYGQPFTSVARYSSDARMVYRSGAKPIEL